MKIITFFASAFVTFALVTHALANDNAATTAPEGGYKGNGKSVSAEGGYTGNGKKVSLSGKARCAKCFLHQSDTCQTVIQSKDNGTIVTYYVVQSDLAKKLHGDVCQAPHKVKVTGFVDDVGGKQQLTLTKFTVKDE